MIRKATENDIGRIIEITRACAKHMISNGVFQWNEHYPNSAAFKNDVDRQELYVLETVNEVIGCIVISTFMDDEYVPVQWLTPNKNNIYIHRLAVHPQCQGQGFAQELMCFAENFARKHEYNSIRLDTFSKNNRNQKFYELRGYQKLNDIYFPMQSNYPFHCYELIF